ncbi:hypothetical protein P879_00256 [Paragonimus westermani]|uniref:NTR domain-containing protein n=1 Tax=Paragonimus westermani TaxID=34504 RepID=A0A8T0DZ04_9TREM|nr:hypothetical protein P879_00256 [Paragonimus westermani]
MTTKIGLIQDLTTAHDDRQYLAYVYEVYKDTKRYFRPTQYTRITYRCDRFHTGPTAGQVYLLTGLFFDGTPNVDSCSWKAKWSEVTRQQKRYLRLKYHLFCGICKIQRVHRIEPEVHQQPDTCYVPISPNQNEMVCRDRFSLCRYRRHTKTCEFNRRTPYDICEKWLSSYS